MLNGSLGEVDREKGALSGRSPDTTSGNDILAYPGLWVVNGGAKATNPFALGVFDILLAFAHDFVSGRVKHCIGIKKQTVAAQASGVPLYS